MFDGVHTASGTNLNLVAGAAGSYPVRHASSSECGQAGYMHTAPTVGVARRYCTGSAGGGPARDGLTRNRDCFF
eukprot:SAG31_NODE_2618_length_5366_cov_2.137650_1_plen_73_part_10